MGNKAGIKLVTLVTDCCVLLASIIKSSVRKKQPFRAVDRSTELVAGQGAIIVFRMAALSTVSVVRSKSQVYGPVLNRFEPFDCALAIH